MKKYLLLAFLVTSPVVQADGFTSGMVTGFIYGSAFTESDDSLIPDAKNLSTIIRLQKNQDLKAITKSILRAAKDGETSTEYSTGFFNSESNN